MARPQRDRKPTQRILDQLEIQQPLQKPAPKKTGTSRRPQLGLRHDPRLTDDEEVRCLVCGVWKGNYDPEAEEDDARKSSWCECSKCKLWQHTYCQFGDADAKVPNDYQCDVCDSGNKRYANIHRRMSYERWMGLRGLTVAAKAASTDKVVDLSASPAPEDVDVDADAVASESDEDMGSDVDDDEEDGDHDLAVPSARSKRKPADDYKEARPKRQKSKQVNAINKAQNKQSVSAEALKTKRASTVKVFTNVVKLQIPKDDVELLKDSSVEELAEQWSEILESIIFHQFPESEYATKLRSLLINIKNNSLITRMINNEFKLEDIPHLTNDQMKTKSARERDEEIRQKELNKHVIKQSINNVPLVKITHKGEEVLENPDYQFDDPNSVYVEDQRIEEVENMKKTQPNESQDVNYSDEENNRLEEQNRNIFHANAVGFDEYDDNNDDNEDDDNEDDGNHDVEAGESDHEQKLNYDAMIDDDDEFEGILHDRRSATPDPQNQQTEPSSEGYDPASVEIPKDEPLDLIDVWKGNTDLGFSPFASEVRFITTTDTNGDISFKCKRIFDDLISVKGGHVSLDGRLSSSTADDYLDKISSSRNLYLYEIVPSSGVDETLVGKSWDFYNRENKYGVIGRKPDYVKDIYVICQNKSGMMNNRPIFFDHFAMGVIDKFMDETADNKMLLVFVVSKTIEFTEENVEDAEDEDEDDYEPTPELTTKASSTNSNPLGDIQSILSKLSSGA